MQDDHQIPDEKLDYNLDHIEEQSIITLEMFIFLCFITLGIYNIWWIYKQWRFFNQKERSDILPAARAILSVFFLNYLFIRIYKYAGSKGYQATRDPFPLYIGFLIFNLLARLPDPYWIISLLAFIFLIPPFKALNYAKENTEGLIVIEQSTFSGRQIALIIVSATLWILILLGFLMGNEEM